MDVILDTNALSAIAEGEAAAVEQMSRARQIAIPVIVLGEYRFGIAQSRKAAEYERWLLRMTATCQVLHVDETTAVAYARVRLSLSRAGTPIPSNDLWIAALAGQHEMPVLSNDRHFDAVPGIRRIGFGGGRNVIEPN